MQEVNSDPTKAVWGRVNPQTPPLAGSQQDWVSYRDDLKRWRDMATVDNPAPVVCAIGFSFNPDFRSRSEQLDNERLKEKDGAKKDKGLDCLIETFDEPYMEDEPTVHADRFSDLLTMQRKTDETLMNYVVRWCNAKLLYEQDGLVDLNEGAVALLLYNSSRLSRAERTALSAIQKI